MPDEQVRLFPDHRLLHGGEVYCRRHWNTVQGLAEAFEAITAGRGCERMAAPEALKHVGEKVGSDFDGAVVDALGRTIRDAHTESALPTAALPAVVAV